MPSYCFYLAHINICKTDSLLSPVLKTISTPIKNSLSEPGPHQKHRNMALLINHHYLMSITREPALRTSARKSALVIGKIIGYRKIVNTKVRKYQTIIFTSLQIMASRSFVFKQVHDIYSCKVLYTEKYFNVIAELESNCNSPQNNIYKNSFTI